MLIKPPEDLRWSDVTPKDLYLRRRDFLRAAGVALAAGAAGLVSAGDAVAQGKGAKLPNVKKSGWGEGETLTPYEEVTTYNNFYEFGTDKDDPARNAASLKPRPWTVIDRRRCRRSRASTPFDDLVKPYQLEERIYRLRCVEAWSMVIPWVGFPLARPAQAASSRRRRRSSSSSRRCCDPARCRASGVRCSTGRTSRACGSTKRCIR